MVDARGDFERQLALLLTAPLPLTFRAGVGDDAFTDSLHQQARAPDIEDRIEWLGSLGLDGLVDGQLSGSLEGRIGALYRSAVGSTISGGSAEILQVVIARRGLGLA